MCVCVLAVVVCAICVMLMVAGFLTRVVGCVCVDGFGLNGCGGGLCCLVSCLV